MTQREYVRLTAITLAVQLRTAISGRYPQLTPEELQQMILEVIDGLARIHGFAIRREVCSDDEDSD
jgi:hypothetical protein